MNLSVSIVVPCFNAAEFLQEAIGSALAQTYPFHELTVLDDGSSDGSAEVVRTFTPDKRIRLLGPYGNKGPFVLRNEGIRQSTGDLIAFLDADDVWEPEKLCWQVKEFERNADLGLCHTRIQKLEANGEITATSVNPAPYQGMCFEQLLRKNGIGNSSVVVPRKVFDDVGLFDETFRYRGDWEMWTRIAHKYPVSLVDRPLTIYRQHEGNVSKNYKRLRVYAIGIVEKYLAAYGPESTKTRALIEETLTDTYRDYGVAALIDRDFARARDDLWTALRRRPADPTTLLSLAKAYIYPLIGKR